MHSRAGHGQTGFFLRHKSLKWRAFWVGCLGSIAALLLLVSHRFNLLQRSRKAGTAVDDLFGRQSATLSQAVAQYALRNDRPPPPHYERWFRFAKERQCLIDDYNQIYRDFEPFHQLARSSPVFFRDMVERSFRMAREEDLGMKAFEIRNGQVQMGDDRASNYDNEWTNMLNNLSSLLPDMQLVINHRDEPRVVFNTRAPNVRDSALELRDAMAFRNSPAPTSKYYKEQKHCLIANQETGFLAYANDANSFLSYSASADFSTDLYPILSQSKLYPCFSDIVFPSEFHYNRSRWSPKYRSADNIKWADKKPVLYWRGQSTGGWISGSNYRSFPRFKLVEIGRKHADIMDVAISSFYSWFCQLEGCDADSIIEEYNITGFNAAREESFAYRYVFDVDGNAWSGRYLGLLKSGSLVFKSTVFQEYFQDWLQPFEHYIPVLPDLSDLVTQIEWARTHDEEAHRIQTAGKEFVERVLTDNQNDCYWALVLLEWARLYNP